MDKMRYIAAFVVMTFSVAVDIFAGGGDKLTENNVSVLLNGIGQVEDSIKVDILMRMRGHNSKCVSGVRYTPYLYSEKDCRKEFLPPVIIAGRTSYKSYIRSQEMKIPVKNNARVIPYEIIRDRSESKVDYSVIFKREDWMDGASLCLLIDEIGCGRNKRNDIRMLADALIAGPEQERLRNVVLHFDYAEPPVEMGKTRFISETAYLDYVVNKTAINPGYMDNKAKLARINGIFKDVTGQEGVTLKKIDIEGYASPEGTYDWNKKLSEGRARSLSNYLKLEFPSLENVHFNMHFGGENWDDLKIMLKESSHPWRYEAIDIICNYGIMEGRERKLMDLRMGDPYRYMLKEYFPYLRKSIVTIEYSVKCFDLEEAKRVFEVAPQNLSLSEMHMIASTYDRRSKEFQRILETAAIYYPDDEYLNLNLAILALENNDPATAGARLAVVKTQDSAEYYNAAGAYEMLGSGDIAKAREYFKKAASMGSNAAKFNEKQLETTK